MLYQYSSLTKFLVNALKLAILFINILVFANIKMLIKKFNNTKYY
jgi:hypothetical protein